MLRLLNECIVHRYYFLVYQNRQLLVLIKFEKLSNEDVELMLHRKMQIENSKEKSFVFEINEMLTCRNIVKSITTPRPIKTNI